MVLASYNPSEVFSLPPDNTATFKDLLSATINQNTTFTKQLGQAHTGTVFDEKFSLSDEQTNQLFTKYAIEPKDYARFSDATSHYDLENKLQFHNSNLRESEVIQNAGISGLALSFVAGGLDPAGWIIGGAAGKAAQLGSNYYKLSNAGIRVSQGLAGVMGGVGSIGALDYSLNEEATPESMAIAGILGFGIGFGTGGGMLRPAVREAIENTGTNGVQVNPVAKTQSMFKFMNSSADNMKESANSEVSALGFKLTPSIRDVGQQIDDTAHDMLAEYNRLHNLFRQDFDSFRNEFKQLNGRDMTLDDEKVFLEQGHRVDFEYSKLKSQLEQQLKEEYSQNKITTLKEEYDNNYSNALTKKEKTKLTKDYNKKLKEIDNLSEEDLSKIKQQVIDIASRKLPEIIGRLDSTTQKFLDITQKFHRSFADDINETDLNGLKGLDKNFYMTRAYDFNKIEANIDGAKEAFKQGLLANFRDITPEIEQGMEEMASNIVNKIANAKANYDAFDADLNVIRNELVKTKYTPKQLKGRTLTLDASKLIDFMQDDIVGITKGYTRKVGGELALKRSIGVDNKYTANDLIKDKNITGEDLKYTLDAINRVKGVSEFDPNANSVSSRLIRGFNALNYINFGGWFGVNTATDLVNIMNDFDFSRTMKYITSDITDALRKGNSRETKRFANYLGLACESLTNDRALLMGGESVGHGSNNLFEHQLGRISALTGKLSGLNMTIDLMDRVASMTSLDYILTKDTSHKNFTRTINRLGLTPEDINALRNSNFATFENGTIKNVNLDALDNTLRRKLERGIRRAVEDTVLKANELDTPMFLSELAGSKQLARAMFQFMKFPVIAYNKLGIKMKENFNLANSIISTAVGASILTLTNQAKDIGKAESRYDLTTKEGILNNSVSVLERLPFLSVVSIPQSYVDILGRLGSSALDTDYKGRPTINFGITKDRLEKLATAGGDILNGKPTTQDLLTATSYAPFQTLPYLQPFTNMFRDEVKGKIPQETSHIRYNSSDLERLIGANK